MGKAGSRSNVTLSDTRATTKTRMQDRARSKYSNKNLLVGQSERAHSEQPDQVIAMRKSNNETMHVIQQPGTHTIHLRYNLTCPGHSNFG